MSAIAYLGSLKEFVAKAEYNSENSIFRLSYQFTCAFLVGASVLLSAAEFFGKPIQCITELPKHVINTYCWISSTFTIQDYYQREDRLSAQPGVSSPTSYEDDIDIQRKWIFHNYYQWVVFFLCFMAFLCYLPKLLWKLSEDGLIEAIGAGLKCSIYKEEEICCRKNAVVEYMVTHIKMHNSYVFKYWFCEVLAFVNIIGQMFLVDRFLGGEFMKYGLNVIDYTELDQSQRVDPMIFVFPRMTKCHFHQFGSSGTIERKDAFCLLPLNILNEKTFIFIWFWYAIMASLLLALLIYRFLLLALPGLRPRIMHQHSKVISLDVLKAFTNKSNIGDWWIMYVLSKNINHKIYQDIMNRLAKEVPASGTTPRRRALPSAPSKEGLSANSSV